MNDDKPNNNAVVGLFYVLGPSLAIWALFTLAAAFVFWS